MCKTIIKVPLNQDTFNDDLNILATINVQASAHATTIFGAKTRVEFLSFLGALNYGVEELIYQH